ncbi:C-terminal helicase domain-containing protein [Streptomyces hyaluromycini]|uniref:C-terminal helicase domain-containing protein n=1 Tax=Streptomyces hyaluromycini TaxID=1377993 RepID=A0ABV1X5V9_9ACTN
MERRANWVAAAADGIRLSPRQQPPVITGPTGAASLARPTAPARGHSLGRIRGVRAALGSAWGESNDTPHLAPGATNPPGRPAGHGRTGRVPGADAPVLPGRLRNAEEAAAVRRVVDGLLAGLPPDATVGVVTPFRAQKETLTRMWRDDDRVRVGTVHTFQGGQRDVMVLSPVAAHNTPPRTTHWVASQVNLWNVAVTRAKSQLITVGGRAFWQDQSGLPALLAARSAPLGADDGDTAAEAGVSGPVTEAREDLTDRLQRYLAGRGITDLERAVLVGGHPVDLLFTDAGENTAVLIDPGPRTSGRTPPAGPGGVRPRRQNGNIQRSGHCGSPSAPSVHIPFHQGPLAAKYLKRE